MKSSRGGGDVDEFGSIHPRFIMHAEGGGGGRLRKQASKVSGSETGPGKEKVRDPAVTALAPAGDLRHQADRIGTASS